MRRTVNMLLLTAALVLALAGCTQDKAPDVTFTPTPAATASPDLGERAGDAARGMIDGAEDLVRGAAEGAGDLIQGAGDAARDVGRGMENAAR